MYEVQPEKSRDGKKRRVLHRNMLSPCEAILEESEGFHLKKENHKKPKQAASHKFVNNTSDIESNEDEFQGLTLIQSIRVRKREGPAVKDS